MSLPKYPEYKDSGVAWLGALPAHWRVQRFKWLIERNDGGVWGNDPDGEDDTVVLRSTEQTVDGHWKLDEPARRKLTEAEKQSSTLEPGDLLITKSSGSSLHIGKTTLVDKQVAELSCCYSNFMQRLRLNDHMLPKLAWYLMNNGLVRRQFDLASNSTTGLANLNGTMISEILLPTPDASEQSAIAAFLDRETAKIDALIAEQEKLIALLAEKRQATISHAVTRGLNPDAPMKDSGVEWLGQVPAHWEASSLKRVVSLIESGVSVNSIDEPAGEDAIGVLKTSCVYSGGFNPAENKTVIIEELERVACPVKADTLIVSRMNTPALVGAAGLAKESAGNLFLPDRLWQVHFSGALPEFAHYWTQTCQYRTQVQMACAGTSASMQNLSQDEFLSFKLPLPPKQEQCTIAAFLKREAAKIDSLASEQWKAISLLSERRAALIAAAVTGQVDVRGAAPSRED